MAVVRTSAALTSSYVASEAFEAPYKAAMVLEFDLTWVDSTSTEWYVEWSPDGLTSWRRDLAESTVSGTTTVLDSAVTRAASVAAKWAFLTRPKGKFFRVFVKKTGGAGADALGVSVGWGY